MAGLPLLAAIPLMLYFHRAGMPLSFTGAYFEAMSGLTTTGATVLTNLDALPPSINLWRATLIWIGGMGILVLAVAILPLLGVGGHQVVRAETPGPMKDERLTPRIASTAKALYAVYFVFSILCFLSYRAVGLSWFEAWCHMATTMGLGGFSTWDDGFAHFDSVPVEIVAMVFMLIAGINFATHFNAFRQRSARATRCPEAIPYLVVVLGVGLVISVFLRQGRLRRAAAGAALRHVQHHIHGDHHGLRQHRFRPVAAVCAADHAYCRVSPPRPARPAAASR